MGLGHLLGAIIGALGYELFNNYKNNNEITSEKPIKTTENTKIVKKDEEITKKVVDTEKQVVKIPDEV